MTRDPLVPLPHRVNFIAGHATGLEALRVERTFATLAVDHGIDLRGIAAEDRDVDGALADENFVRDFGHAHLGIERENDDIVQGGALFQRLFFLEADAGEAILAVQVEGFTRNNDRRTFHHSEFGNLGSALLALAILFDESFEVGDGVARDVLDVFFSLGNAIFEAPDLFVGAEAIVLGNTLYLNLSETDDVVAGDLAFEKFFERVEAFVDRFDHGFPGFAFLNIAVDAVLDEDALQRTVVPLVIELAEEDFEFLEKERLGLEGAVLQDLGNRHEVRAAFVNDAGIGRDADLAIGKPEKGLAGHLGIGSGGKVDKNFDILGGIILDPGDLNFAFVVGIDDGIHNPAGGGAEGNGTDPNELGFDHLNIGPDPDLSSAETLAVIADVNKTAGVEVGKRVRRVAFAKRQYRPR